MTKSMKFGIHLATWLPLMLISCSVAADEGAADETTEIGKKAVSILRRECNSCHGPDKQEASLRLDTQGFLFAGGENGSVLSSRDPTTPMLKPSLLLQRIEHADDELLMPPKRRLGESDLAILKAWVQAGAPWQTEEPSMESMNAPSALIGEAWSDPKNPIRVLFEGQRLDLWSLRPIRRPRIPDVANKAWCRNPIDCFVLADWERDGREPAPVASDRVLVQRTGMDMTGLPTSYAQVQSFVQDLNPEKFDTLVEQDLSSPAFGVHWTRMWLDVVRYSDSNGFDWDEFRPNAWRYRDYVVRSMNRDEPFDRFIENQLAGDELLDGPPQDPDEQDRLIATGYLRLGPRDNAAKLFNEQDRARAELMSDLTETTASAMLGLTMSCCRCHDHKTDPLSHVDHYRLRAFFAASYYADDLAIDLQDEQELVRKYNEVLDVQIQTLQKSKDAIFDAVRQRQPEKDEKKKWKNEKLKERMTPEEIAEVDQLESKLKSLRQTMRACTHGLVMQDKADALQPIFVLSGGDHRTPKEPVEPGFPSVLFPNTPALAKPINSTSTGRRLTLARWMASRENPWTARVIVNRIWQNYFGQGIVPTPNDFGTTGALPTHPELLDYLAMELIESGWSLKHVHRLIVTSSTYRQQSLAEMRTSDSQSAIALRTHLRRKSAEQLRDSILYVSDLLQERNGGTPVWPILDAATLAANPAVLDDNETKTKGWYPSPLSDQTVRSLYLIQKRTIRIPWMETFDLPENAVSCGRRDSSLVSPQSLALMNGALSIESSKRIADSVVTNHTSNPSQYVDEVFHKILARNPTESERVSCASYLELRSLAELCLVLLNTNEFAFID